MSRQERLHPREVREPGLDRAVVRPHVLVRFPLQHVLHVVPLDVGVALAVLTQELRTTHRRAPGMRVKEG